MAPALILSLVLMPPAQGDAKLPTPARLTESGNASERFDDSRNISVYKRWRLMAVLGRIENSIDSFPKEPPLYSPPTMERFRELLEIRDRIAETKPHLIKHAPKPKEAAHPDNKTLNPSR